MAGKEWRDGHLFQKHIGAQLAGHLQDKSGKFHFIISNHLNGSILYHAFQYQKIS